MARKFSLDPPPPPLRLLIPLDEARRKIADRIEKAKEILGREINSKDALEQSTNEYYKWDSYNAELLRQIFSNDTISTDYSVYFGVGGGYRSLGEQIEELKDDIKGKIHRLDTISEKLELIPVVEVFATSNKVDTSPKQHFSKVFVVHGHDDAVRETIARFISRLALEPIILHEQASSGRTIIEKLENYSDVPFAVVLLTPDDEGREKTNNGPMKNRARQNVLLELGFFIGKLGRNRVCALYRGDIEIPTDYLGVIYVPFDEGGGWQLRLAKELKAAGFTIDLNNVM